MATGGCDDVGYMWDRTTGKALSKLDGHTDSVIGVKFSQDGKYLASAGMDGLIRVYEVVDSEKTDADTDNKDSAASAPAGKTTKHIQTLEGPSEEIIVSFIAHA